MFFFLNGKCMLQMDSVTRFAFNPFWGFQEKLLNNNYPEILCLSSHLCYTVCIHIYKDSPCLTIFLDKGSLLLVFQNTRAHMA